MARRGRGSGAAPEPLTGDPPGERAGETLDWSEELASIDVTAEDFRRDWNRLVADLGFGHELEPLTLPERPHGMGAETQAFPDTDRTARARLDGVVYAFDTFEGQWRLWAGSADDAP